MNDFEADDLASADLPDSARPLDDVTKSVLREREPRATGVDAEGGTSALRHAAVRAQVIIARYIGDERVERVERFVTHGIEALRRESQDASTRVDFAHDVAGAGIDDTAGDGWFRKHGSALVAWAVAELEFRGSGAERSRFLDDQLRRTAALDALIASTDATPPAGNSNGSGSKS